MRGWLRIHTAYLHLLAFGALLSPVLLFPGGMLDKRPRSQGDGEPRRPLSLVAPRERYSVSLLAAGIDTARGRHASNCKRLTILLIAQ
jgi:hypothetical protein